MRESPPSLLYHGTTRSYHDKSVELFGCYRQHGAYEGERIYLADASYLAIRYALTLAKAFNAIPVLLKVDTDEALRFGRFEYWYTDQLPARSYQMIELKPKGIAFAEMNLDEILKNDPFELLSGETLPQL